MQLYAGAPIETRPELLPKLAIKPWIRPPPDDFILANARVVDPASSSVRSGLQNVHIKQGLIASVESAKGLRDEEKNCKVVDVKGAYLPNMTELFQSAEQDINLRTTYVLKEMLLRGFTTVRDTGGASKRLALAIEEGLIPGPRLVQCGRGLSQTGGHGDFSPVGSSSSTTCCGVIKVMVGGGVASETDAIETVQFTAEEIKAITTTARQMGGKIVTAHAYTVEAIRHAIENGVLGIEHGNLIDRATANLMASNGIFLTPTLSCYGIMVRPPFEDFLPPDGKIKNAQVMAKGLDALKIAHEAGVAICYGSDLLTSMHALQTEEFTVRGGVLPADVVLRHATTNAAKMLGQTSYIGTISPGAYADLLILAPNANPLEDVTVLDRPEECLLAVMKGGRVYQSVVEGLDVDGYI
ncbi:Amidohydro-rel domain-containing protein [Mycena kentingensis (nom. inval.)]|nr:Amidohydro-rel domain-containing protein [Mycena kentingensis (nom. inval.)]